MTNCETIKERKQNSLIYTKNTDKQIRHTATTNNNHWNLDSWFGTDTSKTSGRVKALNPGPLPETVVKQHNNNIKMSVFVLYFDYNSSG